MRKSDKVSLGLFAGALLLTIGGVAAVSDVGIQELAVDERLERSCHREIVKRSPDGHQDLETHRYTREAQYVGVLTGSVKSRYTGKGWAPITWTCRIHPKSGRILRVEFAMATSATRLRAAATAF